jgi:hypothetical protein
MRPPLLTHNHLLHIAESLATFDYLTAGQLARLLYKETSHRYVRTQLNTLIAAGLVVALPRQTVTQPRFYCLTAKGYTALAAQGRQFSKRVRPAEDRDKAVHYYFVQHTSAVTDVLISAWLLSQHVQSIQLIRLVTERELKRKLSVPLANRTVCLEPDASVQFRITETWHTPPQIWDDFYHIEVYRTQMQEWRFKRKIHTYVAYAQSPIHHEFFQTPALSIALFCASSHLAQTLKRWTEEALAHSSKTEQAERFFFTSLPVAAVSPTELFLTPVWEQAFGSAKTPLLLLDAEKTEAQPHH